MKKLLLFLSIVILSLALFSCGNKIDLEDYKIVIPENADISTKYASEIFADLVEEKSGIRLEIVTDEAEEAKCEILIGETNRKESKTDTVPEGNEYYLFKRNNKIVMKASGIYIGAPLSEFVNKYAKMNENGECKTGDVPKKPSVRTFTFAEKHESVIFMIGDGMGENHIKMAEQNGMNTFIPRSYPVIGTVKTRSQSEIDGTATATDSSASATAMATGYKTVNGYVGVDKNGNPVQNVRELAFSLGAKTAVVTTDVITGGTPSAYLCHNASRENDDELEAEIKALADEGKIDYIAGDVADNLLNSTREALRTVSKNKSQFFVMIEEGQIDKASHDKDEDKAIEYVKRYNDAVAYATQFVMLHPKTALVVTADHETGKLTPSSGAPCGYFFLSYAHTNKDVPVFQIGAGLLDAHEKTIENTDLAKFCAEAYTTAPFGDQAQ